MPIDDRAAAQNESQSLDIVQRETLDALQASRSLTRTRRFAVRSSQWFVVVALLAVGRPRAKVPKKMPIVTPSTASCAPNGPFAAMNATGIGATRYHGFSFILGSPAGMGAGRVFEKLTGNSSKDSKYAKVSLCRRCCHKTEAGGKLLPGQSAAFKPFRPRAVIYVGVGPS
jgi:hypothetical protein